jgi:hypothetical protein
MVFFLHVFCHVFLPYFAILKANQIVIAMLNHMKYPFAACIFWGHQTCRRAVSCHRETVVLEGGCRAELSPDGVRLRGFPSRSADHHWKDNDGIGKSHQIIINHWKPQVSMER